VSKNAIPLNVDFLTIFPKSRAEALANPVLGLAKRAPKTDKFVVKSRSPADNSALSVPAHTLRSAVDPYARELDFLSRGYGPEQQSLLKLIATLVEPAPAQLVGGEGDPGLSLAGAGGHA